MRYSIPIVVSVVLVVGFILFDAYYFMQWPFQPSLEVDDSVIAEWLQQDGIVIYRRGEELGNSRIYLVKGERTEHGCTWHVSTWGSDDYVVINRAIATNHTTCESLFEEGIQIE